MSKVARVTSIEAVRDFKNALIAFEESVRDALTSFLIEVQKAVDWIEQDRMRYWPAQVAEAWDEVNHAKIDLTRCKMQKFVDHEPACYEERKALQRARERQRLCQAKYDATRHWCRVVRHEAEEFEGRLSQIRRWTDADFPRAIAALERMITALDRYTERKGRDEKHPGSVDLTWIFELEDERAASADAKARDELDAEPSEPDEEIGA